MSERLENPCATCPRRGFASKIMARAGLVEANSDCPGPFSYTKGTVTQEVFGADDKTAPKQKAYVISRSDGGEQTYTNVSWAEPQQLCSQEEHLLSKDELPFLRYEADGQHHVTNLAGTEEAIAEYRSAWVLGHCLDASSEEINGWLV